MKHRIYIMELIRRWNALYRGDGPRMTMILLAELMWPDEKRAKLVKRNRLYRMNKGIRRSILVSDAYKLCELLRCDFNQLFGRELL